MVTIKEKEMIDIIRRDIWSTYPPKNGIAELTPNYKMHCSPTINQLIFEEFLSHGSPLNAKTGEVTESPEFDKTKNVQFQLPGIGYLSVYPDRDFGYTIERMPS